MSTKNDLTLQISGMHCGACVNRLRQALNRLPGVEVEDVQVGSARLRYQQAEADRDAIHSAIQKTGFEVIPDSGTFK